MAEQTQYQIQTLAKGIPNPCSSEVGATSFVLGDKCLYLKFLDAL